MNMFLLTRPMRDVTGYVPKKIGICKFLLTRPMRDVTTHRDVCSKNCPFLLTRPMRDVTLMTCFFIYLLKVSTHTPHAGRDEKIPTENSYEYVSTHTPHAGRDIMNVVEFAESLGFYSHAPCGT